MSEITGFFAGIGALLISLAIAYMIYQWTRIIKGIVDIDERYNFLEIIGINKMALKRGIDLEKEIQKRSLIKKKRRSLRREIQKEILDDFFGKEKDKETKS